MMSNPKELVIQYDDDIITVMDRINEILRPYDISLDHDGKPHDGFDVYFLKVKNDKRGDKL